MNPVQLTPRPFAADIVFGEGLRWHDSRLWVSDMLGRKVYAFDAAGRRELVAEVPGKPNGLGFLPDGRLVIGSMEDGRILRREHDGSVQVHADMSAIMTGYTGDMAVDSLGRIYVDDVGYRVFEGAPLAPGRLILVDETGQPSVLEESLMFPNGLWITRDGGKLMFAEGRLGRLFSYTRRPNGTLADKRLVIEFEKQPIDGLTIDAEDGVWLCQPYEKRVLRLQGSQVTHTISFPDIKPVSVCLGGEDLKTLFIVAADYTLERMATNDCWAALYTVQVDVAGFPLLGRRSQ